MLKNKALHIYSLVLALLVITYPIRAQDDESAEVSVPHQHAPASLEQMPPLTKYEKSLLYATDGNPAIVFFSGAYKKDNWNETAFTFTKRIKLFDGGESSYSRIQFSLKPYEAADKVKVKTYDSKGKVKNYSFQEPDEILVSYADTWGPRLTYIYNIPDVKPGVIIDYTYTIYTSLGSGLRFNYWYIQEMAYTVTSRFTLDMPRDFMPFKSSVENLSMSLTPDRETTPQRKLVTWQFADIPAIEPEPMMPAPSQLFARLVVDYQWPSSFTSEPRGYWRQVGRSQAQRVKRFVEDSITLEALARNIVASEEEALVKVKKISRWIHKNIKNLASLPPDELLDGNELVHDELTSVDELLDKGVGSTLEINKLAVGLMQAAGLEAYLAFSVSRETGVLHYNILDTNQLNRSFVAVRLYGNEVVFSNPSAYDAPPEIIPWSLQGAIAVICTPAGSVFFRLPVEQQNNNISEILIDMTVDHRGGAKGKVESLFSGQESIEIRHAAFTLPESMKKDYILMLLKQKLPGARIESFSYSGLGSHEENIRISASVYWPGYLKVNGRRMRIASELEILPFKPQSLSSERRYPLSFKYSLRRRIRERIKLPQGYTLEHQALNNRAISEMGSLVDILSVGPGNFERERELIIKRIFYKPEEIDNLKSFFKFEKLAHPRAAKASKD